METNIDGQLSTDERSLLINTVMNMTVKPEIVLEVGTWLGGGSTLHILKGLHKNGVGHLWGVEASSDIYEKMIANISSAVPEAESRFTPLLGISTEVIPGWLNNLPAESKIDLVFLDGGDNPREQIDEFELLAGRIKVGGILMSHDAYMRKGKWLIPYISLLDNWESEVLALSANGLLHARKVKDQPSEAARKAAQRKLRKMRLEPMELFSRLVPSKIRGMLVRALPKSLHKIAYRGRK